jgi:hypothetical protein
MSSALFNSLKIFAASAKNVSTKSSVNVYGWRNASVNAQNGREWNVDENVTVVSMTNVSLSER